MTRMFHRCYTLPEVAPTRHGRPQRERIQSYGEHGTNFGVCRSAPWHAGFRSRVDGSAVAARARFARGLDPRPAHRALRLRCRTGGRGSAGLRAARGLCRDQRPQHHGVRGDPGSGTPAACRSFRCDRGRSRSRSSSEPPCCACSSRRSSVTATVVASTTASPAPSSSAAETCLVCPRASYGPRSGTQGTVVRGCVTLWRR